MRLIASADWHVRNSNPQFRIDNYSETILGKVGFIVDMCNKYSAQGVVAGDIFHNVKAGTPIINKLIAVLRKARKPFLAVAGQHDLQNHNISDLTPTPLKTLMEAGVIQLLDHRGYNDCVYGISWNGEFDEEMDIPDNSVVLIHHCITPGDPAFFLEEDGMSAETAMEELSQFKYIISGDYHVPHTLKKEDRRLINCGCIGRSNKDQKDHKPRVYLIDTTENTVKPIFIPIKPHEEVFSSIENNSKLDEEISKHIEEIVKSSENEETRPEFMPTVRRIMKGITFTDRQREIAEHYYNEVRDV